MDRRLERLTAILNEARQIIRDYNNYHKYTDGHIISVHISDCSDDCEVFTSPVLPETRTPIYSQNAATGGYKDYTNVNGIQFYTFFRGAGEPEIEPEIVF